MLPRDYELIGFWKRKKGLLKLKQVYERIYATNKIIWKGLLIQLVFILHSLEIHFYRAFQKKYSVFRVILYNNETETMSDVSFVSLKINSFSFSNLYLVSPLV